MDHQWRPNPPQNTICPICSFSHFPFCPPPQHHHHHHPPYNHFPPPPPPPPQPDYPRPAFDPYPPPYMAEPMPIHTNPNFDRQHYPINPIYDYNNNNNNSNCNGYVSEVDRSYKRPRVDEFASNSSRFLSDDERRLKLIRDHGGASSGPPMQPPPPPPPPPRNVEHPHYNNQTIRPNEDYWQAFSGSQNGNLGQNYPNMNERRGYLPPLPASPPPPLPVDLPPLNHSSPPKACHSLFPVVHVSSSPMVHSSYPPILSHASTGFISEESQTIHRTAMQFSGEGQSFPLNGFSPEKPKVIDASHLFKLPHRATRPDHLVIILRGLPGSGKSYLAKMLRDLEVENGGDAPRIHSMDDYFMTEVEKVEESDVSKSSSSVRSKKSVVKKVMEYCYEPEMEEAYRSSMLKAFKKTLEEGIFTFIIVDDRNLRVADFAQFWAIAKRLGYEVYILEATYKDPAGCAARNVHGFTLDEIRNMAGQWEEAPSLYLQLEIKSLFHGDDLKESGIQEVVMDMGDGDIDEGICGLQEGKPEKIIVPSVGDDAPDDPSKDGKRWDAEGAHPTEEVKELGRSKWSDDLDEDDSEKSQGVRGNINALSGLIQAYSKDGKSVRWSDQVGNTGFSISAAKKAPVLSLVIGPGAGYNLKSNPLPEEESSSASSTGKSKKQRMFQEQLRAERESFKAVFDRRKQRIGLDLEEE